MPSQLPVENYNFVLTRLRYLAAAVINIPNFRPDGKPPAAFTDLPPLAEQSFAALLVRYNAANLAEGTMRHSFGGAYAEAVTVYACMKSCFRADPNCRRAIRSLPKAARTPDRTVVRMKALTELWGTLPNVPGTNAPLLVGEMTAGSFGSMATDFDAKVGTARLENSKYAGALALLHDKLATWDRLVSAATEQGRARFKPGTPERAIIDRIPVEPSTQQPGAGVITEAASPAPGAVRFQCGAAHATSFQIWHKGPGATVFTPVAEVLLPGEYAATGLAAGTHEYQVVGENSRGTGAASAPVSLAVAAEAVA